MSIENQIKTCTEGFERWKERAFFCNDLYEARQALDRAFFWMELRSAFMFLHTVEQMGGNTKDTREKIMKAKINLSRKLSEHVKDLINGI